MSRWGSPAHVCAAAVGLVIVLGSFGGSAQHAKAADQRRSAPSTSAVAHTSAGLLDETFCDLIGNNTVQAAGLELLNYFLKKKISTTSIYTTSVLTSIGVLCKPVMKRAGPAVARFLGLSPRPKSAPTRSDFRASFGQTTAAGISEQLRRIGWTRSPSQVNTITGQLCDDIERARSPRPTLKTWFVNAKLDSLVALNGLVAYAATCNPAPTAAQLGYLTSSITSYLTDNTYPRDYTPPVTLLWTPTESLLANGLVGVNITWSSFDFGGRVTKQELLIGVNSRWYSLRKGYAEVKRGQYYNLATRAQDEAGNWSGWVYTPVYTARVS